MRTPDLSGVSIVGAGAFNPAIVHPLWLRDKGLIPENVAEHATQQGGERQMVVSTQIASFVADWLAVQVTQKQAIFTTVDQGRELDLRDLAKGFFNLLPETPVGGLGINADAHFKTDDEGVWHAFGDRFLPKDFWEPLFQGERWKPRPDGEHVGMRVMTVEVERSDPETPGHVRIEIAPSVRVRPNGVFIGINSHFELSQGDERADARTAARVLDTEWEATRALESELISTILEAL